MTKINNQNQYIPDTEISVKDFWIGSDYDKNGKTVNFKVLDVIKRINSFNGQYAFDYLFYQQPSLPNPNPANGGFFSNDNNTDPNSITEFYFSKFTESEKNLSVFFQELMLNNVFNIKLSQQNDLNSVFYFEALEVIEETNFFTIKVDKIYSPTNKELEFNNSSVVVFELKSGIGLLTPSVFGAFAMSLDTEDVIQDADVFNYTDISDSNKQKKTTFGNIKSILKTYFDTLYQLKLTDINFGAFTNSLVPKVTPVDDDQIAIMDSEDSNKGKKLSWANIKVTIKNYFDTIYAKVNLDSTTVISGPGATINSGDNTKFDFAIVGKFVNPSTFVKTDVNISLTAQTTTHLTAQTESYIWVKTDMTIEQSLTPPVESDFDIIIGHWVLVHSNLTNINVINSFPMYSDGVAIQLQQTLSFDGFRKKKGTNKISAGTTGTRLSHTGGTVIKHGGGGISKRPVFVLTGTTDDTFLIRNRDDVDSASTQSVDVTNIDLAGVTTALSNNRFGAHKVWKFSSSLVRVQRGQYEYFNIDEALAGIDNDLFIDSPNGDRNGIHIGWIIFKKNTSWGSGGTGVDGEDYKFVDVLAGKSSGGGFLATLQAAYNVSILPQILVDLIRGAFTLRSGTGSDLDNIFQGQNNIGALTSWIKGNGTSSFDILHRHFSQWQVIGTSSTTVNVINGNVLATSGTIASVTLSLDTTLSSIPFLSITGVSAANTSTYFKETSNFNTSLIQGFDYVFRFAINDTNSASARTFVGLFGTTAVPVATIDPSTYAFPNVGVGNDSGETNLSILHNDNVGTSTKIPLGSGFPAHTLTDAYELRITALPVTNSANSIVFWGIKNLITGVVASGTITTDLPRNTSTGTSSLTHTVLRNNGATAISPSLKFSKISFVRLN